MKIKLIYFITNLFLNIMSYNKILVIFLKFSKKLLKIMTIKLQLDEKKINILAGLLLIFIFLITVFSVKDDSLTRDERWHLTAGYSYLTQKDMRLNPIHPPLVKDLAAFPLLFIKNIKFPSEIDVWQKSSYYLPFDYELSAFANYFLFKTSNPVDKMVFWGRIPIILILILLGFFIFKFSKEFFNKRSALLALFLFSFSPTFLAHGRLITTDVAAAFGVVFATYYFIKFLQHPSLKNIIISGVSLGIAQLLKFSIILLIPFFIMMSFFWCMVNSKEYKNILKRVLLIFLISFMVVWLVYFYHTLNYPKEKQLEHTKIILDLMSLGNGPISKIFQWEINTPLLKPLAQYQLGVLMAMGRITTGSNIYFLGKIVPYDRTYFPFVYLIKEPLPFHILTIIAVVFLIYLIWKNLYFKKIIPQNWAKNHFIEISMLMFIFLYWLMAINSNLNIGIRHLLPVFPFTFILVSKAIILFLKDKFLQKTKFFIFSALLIWQVLSVISIYPHFLSYFNEIVGGPDKAYLFVGDSNLDWGQDLKRLKAWVEKNKIEKIYIDYFGGADVKYYFGDKYIPWNYAKDPKTIEKGSYLAVSATKFQKGIGEPSSMIETDFPTGYYLWLKDQQLVKKIGYSIFVFKIN